MSIRELECDMWSNGWKNVEISKIFICIRYISLDIYFYIIFKSMLINEMLKWRIKICFL